MDKEKATPEKEAPKKSNSKPILVSEDSPVDNIAMSAKERAKKIREMRQGRFRKDSRRQDVLAFSKRPGFVRRVVNNKPGRVERFERDGWAVVMGDETGGEVTARDPKKPGTAVTKVVGTGKNGPITGVLMEIPEEIFNEDKAEKLAKIKRNEDLMEDKLKNEWVNPAEENWRARGA